MQNKKNSEDLIKLKKRLEDGIKKSGFPLEMEIGGILKEKSWPHLHSNMYIDMNNLAFKELDILAFRPFYKNFEVNIFIECKSSIDSQWIFFSPSKYTHVCLYHLKNFPKRKRSFDMEIKPSLKKTVFNVFESFCNGEDIALNSAVFMGETEVDKKQIKSRAIKNGVNSVINALIFRNLRYFEEGRQLKRSINFNWVIFDNFMFNYHRENNNYELSEKKYIKLLHQIGFNPSLYSTETKNLPIVNMLGKYMSKVGGIHLIEFIHKDYFQEHLNNFDKSLEELNKIPLKNLIKDWYI